MLHFGRTCDASRLPGITIYLKLINIGAYRLLLGLQLIIFFRHHSAWQRDPCFLTCHISRVQIRMTPYHAGSTPSVSGSVSDWRRSSWSMANGDCVEVSSLPTQVVGVRDSKSPRGHVLRFTTAGWGAFLENIRKEAFSPQN